MVQYKDKNYIIENYCEMKCEDGQWRKAVNYISVETGRRYCRLSDDFDKKFKEK